MADEKVTITLSAVGLEYLDKLIAEDAENVKSYGDGAPDHMKQPLDRERAVFMAIMFTFLVMERAMHPQVAFGLCRNMAGKSLEENDAVFESVKSQDMGEILDKLREQIQLSRIMIGTIQPPRRKKGNDEPPIH